MNNMVAWKFKCLGGGYRFKAVEPIKLYEANTKCSMCDSKNFEKKIVNVASSKEETKWES